ncbi:hypothetical protein FGG08_000226 [Glutinoglossum americanum]|uniref:Amidoligase enzyme n=1 Tax=Glutinoglossum americanum TaxID=1670608 RepID=A0A9P8IG00_9PEZI|nr:hypothetical protein FGG08_000226 [Glutinoglossum americanum]
MGNLHSSRKLPSKALNEPLNITFGVELEFIVKFNRSDYTPLGRSPEALPSYTLALRVAIRNALERRGILTFDPEQPGVGGGSDGEYSRWAVATDTTIEPPLAIPGEDTSWVAIEVKTRILRLNLEGITELRRGIASITESFCIGVNDSCGLHVHIGNDGKKGFDLQTLKNLSGLLLGFEKHLNSLHPPQRCRPGTWCAPLSNKAEFAPLPPLHRILLIERQRTFDSLLALLADETSSTSAVNFANLAIGGTQTVEFRQHEGTVDERRVVMWVRLVAALVRAAHGMAPSECVEAVREKVDRGGFGPVEFLEWVKVGEEAVEYYKRRLWSHEWSVVVFRWGGGGDGGGGGRRSGWSRRIGR